VARPITVKDPPSALFPDTSERADQRRQSSSGFADAGVRGSAITTQRLVTRVHRYGPFVCPGSHWRSYRSSDSLAR